MNTVQRLRFGWLFGLFVAIGCGQDGSTKDAGGRSEAPPAPASPAARVEDGVSTQTTSIAKSEGTGEAFHKLSLDEALKKAKGDNKVVMVDFHADWCSPCRKLKDTTWKDAKVQSWLRDQAVAVKIDVDKAEELSGQHNISGSPGLVFLRPDGSEMGRLIGYRDADVVLKDATKLMTLK